MSDLQVQSDMQYLAGRLEHRGANTAREREAAEYIRARLREYTPGVDLDEFYSTDGGGFLTAAYFAEFAIVALVAGWWPLAGLIYGGVVFTLYLAESNGYAVLSRLMPQYETQNVVARFLSPRPRKLLVAMAHYDSAKDRPLTYPAPRLWVRPGHMLMVFCMFLVLATCAAQSMGVLEAPQDELNIGIRWAAAGLLLAGAAILLRNELLTRDTRGVNDNATGVAALLRLARNLSALPIEDADVYLVATGSNQTGMHGARHFIRSHGADAGSTCFLCLDSVGEGKRLGYVSELGLMQAHRPPRELVSLAAAAGERFGAVEARMVTAHSDVQLLLERGYRALEITAVSSVEADSMRPGAVNHELVEQAADYAEAILRRLAGRESTIDDCRGE